MTNKEALIQAVFDSGFATAGKLLAEQADRFIDYMVDESFLKNNARVERMNGPEKQIDAIGLGTKLLYPATSGTALDSSKYAQTTPSKITLKTSEMIATVKVHDDELEDNIEKEAFVDHLMQMIARKAGNELEVAYLMGRKPGANAAVDIKELFDGWLKRAEDGGHTVDATTFADRFIATDKLSKTLKAIPTKFRTDRRRLRFLIADDIFQDFVDIVGNRTTPLGDAAFTAPGTPTLAFGRVLLQPMSLLPVDQAVDVTGGNSTTLSAAASAGATTVSVASSTNLAVNDFVRIGPNDGTREVKKVTVIAGAGPFTITLDTALVYPHASGEVFVEVTKDGSFSLVTDYQNLIVGIQRDIRIEPERVARERSTYFVVSLRSDVQMEQPDATAILKNLKVK